jgi:hypothetical protein
MRTAYYMVSPANTIGAEPLISFNPYLETNLQGTVSVRLFHSKSSKAYEAVFLFYSAENALIGIDHRKSVFVPSANKSGSPGKINLSG